MGTFDFKQTHGSRGQDNTGPASCSQESMITDCRLQPGCSSLPYSWVHRYTRIPLDLRCERL